MLTLNSSIAAVPRVGPKYQYLLTKLEIKTVEDLLYHFPSRYDDFSIIKKIAEVKENETVTVTGELSDIKNIYTKFGKKLTRSKVVDETGQLDIIWFNQHYLTRVLLPNKTYTFSGKTGTFGGKIGMISPEFEETKPSSLNTGRLVPIYPETAGISSKWLRSRINDVLSAINSLPEYLPLELINKYNFDEFNTAIRNFHFPQTQDNVQYAKNRFEFEEFFLELIKVEFHKSSWLKNTSIALTRFDTKINDFIQTLPFKLTDSQQKALNEIVSCLTLQQPMNTLLEGDVGSGKTVVAAIAAYLTHLNGYKTVYMAPTEILANQHYETFTKFLAPFGLKIELTTGSTKHKAGGYNILIGTHALLFNENLKRIALVIIDEQHRFGVEQRAKMLQLGSDKKTPHLLTMTATPIPRTLALTLYGDLTIAKLTTLPNKDKKITTKVCPESLRTKTYEWLKNRNEPTFIVCPLIDSSDKESMENVKAAQKEFIALKDTVFAGVDVGLLHGRMKSAEKKAVVEQFKQGKIKILISTPVIEVGIDIPEATVIVIESAERYGLASLHQLRGRVGRGSKEGFCFLFMSNNSRKGYTRLKYLENITSGMELAEIDLKTRGYGDLYGTEQHGFKKFKVADLSNLELLEKVKLEAQEFFPKLNSYPLLKAKLELDTKLIGNN